MAHSEGRINNGVYPEATRGETMIFLWKPQDYIVASELKDPIWHSSEWQIGSFSSEATTCSKISMISGARTRTHTCMIGEAVRRCLLGKSEIAVWNASLAFKFQRNKMFLLRSLIKIQYCERQRARPQTARAPISNHMSGGQCHLIHFTILRRFSWPSSAYMCTKVA